MDIIYDYSKLRGRIIEKYGSMSRFSEAVGLSEIALSRKLNNKIDISRENILKWSELLDIPSDEYGVFYFAKKLNDV